MLINALAGFIRIYILTPPYRRQQSPPKITESKDSVFSMLGFRQVDLHRDFQHLFFEACAACFVEWV